MKRRILPYALVLCTAAVLVSCVHRSPFSDEERYYEAFGDGSEIVVTLDAERAKQHLPVPENPVTKRTGRVSLAMKPETTERYPLSAGDYSVRGALEGNFGSFELSAAMLFTDGIDKVKEDGVKYWTDGTLKFGVPEAGMLAFTDGDYAEHVRTSFRERTLKIPHDAAEKMASALAGFYVFSPETMLDLGFDIPLSVLRGMDWALLSIDVADGEWSMSADVAMDSERHAKSFTQILKNQVLGEIRRSGERPDFRALSRMIYQDGVMSHLTDRPLSEEQVLGIYDKVSGMSGGIF